MISPLWTSLFDSVIPAPRIAHRDPLVPVSVGSGLRSVDVEGAPDPDVHVVLHTWRSTAESIIAKRPFCSRIVKPGYHLSQAVRDGEGGDSDDGRGDDGCG